MLSFCSMRGFWIGKIQTCDLYFSPSLRIWFLRGGRGGAAGVFHGAGRGPPPSPLRAERPSLKKTMSDYAPGILHGWLSAALSAVRQPIGKGGARSQSERDGARPNIFFSTLGLQEYFLAHDLVLVLLPRSDWIFSILLLSNLGCWNIIEAFVD